eukprot:scaffold15804_cov60-Phaeocystis_antarctica.AAC.7
MPPKAEPAPTGGGDADGVRPTVERVAREPRARMLWALSRHPARHGLPSAAAHAHATGWCFRASTYTHPSAAHLPAALGSPLGSGHCLHAAHNARHTPRHHSSPQSMDDSTDDEAKPHRHPLRHCACPYAHTHDT